MFAKVYTLAFLAALVAALQIEPLQNANSQGDTRITWINEAADAFNSDFALLNNQRPADGGANVTLSAVPAQDGYTLRATDISNINNEFAVSSPFSIGPEVSSTSTIASSTFISTSISGSGTNTVSVTRNSGSGTVLSVPPTTVSSPTGASPASGASSASSGSGTNTAAQGGATNFNGAASAVFETKVWALGAAVMSLGWVVGWY